MKKNSKKLVLNRETLFHLEHVKGAGPTDTPTCNPSADTCGDTFYCTLTGCWNEN